MGKDNGLDISESQFLKLPSKEQNVILYRNLREIRGIVKGYQFKQKIQFVWLGLLTIAFGLGRYMGVF